MQSSCGINSYNLHYRMNAYTPYLHLGWSLTVLVTANMLFTLSHDASQRSDDGAQRREQAIARELVDIQNTLPPTELVPCF